MSFYCIAVLTGVEESYRLRVQEKLDAPDAPVTGTVHFLRKKMRLKGGKEYLEPFFPGYVFLETEESDRVLLRDAASEKGFLHFLPANASLQPLSDHDENLVKAILSFGSTIGLVPVAFDKGDRIVILDGPFKDCSGRVVAVNRRNKRVNIELDFLNSARIFGLTYTEVRKE